MMDIKIFTNTGWVGGVALRGRYPSRKMRKSQEQYPFYNQILHNLSKFSKMDIKFFTYGGQGAGMGCYPFRKLRQSQEQYPF